MHPLFEEWVRTETRRHFFSRGANAVGTAALASLLGNDFAGPRGDEHAVGRRRRSRWGRTFRRRPSTSSICTWSAGRRRWTCSTTSRR